MSMMNVKKYKVNFLYNNLICELWVRGNKKIRGNTKYTHSFVAERRINYLRFYNTNLSYVVPHMARHSHIISISCNLNLFTTTITQIQTWPSRNAIHCRLLQQNQSDF